MTMMTTRPTPSSRHMPRDGQLSPLLPPFQAHLDFTHPSQCPNCPRRLASPSPNQTNPCINPPPTLLPPTRLYRHRPPLYEMAHLVQPHPIVQLFPPDCHLVDLLRWIMSLRVHPHKDPPSPPRQALRNRTRKRRWPQTKNGSGSHLGRQEAWMKLSRPVSRSPKQDQGDPSGVRGLDREVVE